MTEEDCITYYGEWLQKTIMVTNPKAKGGTCANKLFQEKERSMYRETMQRVLDKLKAKAMAQKQPQQQEVITFAQLQSDYLDRVQEIRAQDPHISERKLADQLSSETGYIIQR